MPLLGPSSYIPVLNEFLAHWALVDAALPAGAPLVLPELGGLAQAQALRTEVGQRMDAVRDALLEVELAREVQRQGRAELRERLEQFGAVARVLWAGLPWPELVPRLPPMDVGPDRFLRPVRDALRLWALLDAEPAPPGVALPLALGPGSDFLRGDMEALAGQLREQALALEEAEFAADVARARRDAVLSRARAMLMSYARAVPGRLGAGALLARELPRLWPLPGHTPEPVAAQGQWDAGAQAARITWEASGEKTLARYEVRGCAGPEYLKSDETALGRVAAEGPREFATSFALGAPGAEAVFRVYVVLETGNERGSGNVPVQRPV